ncbi:M13 family metallopeptidase [Oscillibacter sp. MSJ-31]|uniref:M13 family metallopeptidase n=1 Tax=Oscillibacter sp. MSJ-31 TaxID=2841526 RepID=UPI001C1079D9|nr:M13 family metallopeptidase [Oscillibacter sp. MSJ-31]MBU5457502.1 M13 family metallopeptidase [Oscillibacter sp. MSJ-31]
MMKFQKRFVPLLLALVLTLGTLPVQAAALTRGEAAQALLSAAQDYNPGVQRSDILKGYPDGSLALDGTLTRAQALVMLTRAFGGFAIPVGDNARMALPASSLTNVPAWAAEELSSVLAAGLADGDANEAMSAEALSALLRRAYAAKGTNLRDDYYAAVNKSWLDGSDIPAGLSINGPFYGLSLTVNEQIAAQQVQALLADYLSRTYVDEYFSAKAKSDVEEMIGEFIAIYKERILAQDWMSAETKAKAVKKLDTMGVKVGYPDSWESCLDRAEIKSPAEGGSFFSNVIAIQMAMKQDVLAHQNDAPDKSEWIMTPFTVNACYNPSANDITFPAAILQSPLYDVNASREENLGGIGYIIAHEITHAFDNNGAKFDENGSAADWWTAEDYAAFQQKCQAVAEWYDGQEAYPGIACSGALTISENVADLGAAKCIVAAAKKLDHPDLDKLFRAVANTWASTTSRQMREYLAVTDVHAPDKLRCNRVLQTLPEFYTTYGIRPGDGMWTAPETRVSVW